MVIDKQVSMTISVIVWLNYRLKVFAIFKRTHFLQPPISDPQYDKYHELYLLALRNNHRAPHK